MEKTQKKNMPQNRRLIDSKWVFRNKRDGRFRARLVAQEYTQIPGVESNKFMQNQVNDI